MLKNFWYAIAFSNEVKRQPARLEIMGKRFWAWRMASGQGAFVRDQDLITKQPLGNARADGDLLVAESGQRYAADGSGRALAYPVKERYGWFFVFLGDLPEAERMPIPDLPYLEDPNLKYGRIQGDFPWKVHYARALENGMDAAHAPFVHGGAFGNPDEPEIPDYDIAITPGSGIATIFLKPTPSKGLWSRAYSSKKRDTLVKTRAGYWMPNLSILEVNLPFGQLLVFNAHVPVNDMKTVSKYISLRSFFTGGWANANAHKRVINIFEQDRVIVEAQRPEILPFDIGAELHVKSDALQVAYRRDRRAAFEKGWGLYPRGKQADDVEIPSPFLTPAKA